MLNMNENRQFSGQSSIENEDNTTTIVAYHNATFTEDKKLSFSTTIQNFDLFEKNKESITNEIKSFLDDVISKCTETESTEQEK